MTPPPLNQPPNSWAYTSSMREGKFMLKEIVFYNLFIYIFNIIEILIMKIDNFFKIYLFYTPFLR